MRPTTLQYAQALEELASEGAMEKVSGITKNFLSVLKRRGEGNKAAVILACLEKMDAEKKGIVSIIVVTAHEVAKNVKEKLIARAEILFPEKKVELQYEIDTKVIGGVLFRTDEMLYDVTLATELKSLKKFLLKV